MRAQGLDISHYQKAYVPHANHDFVIIKASDGQLENYLFRTHVKSCDADQVIGAYHYLRSEVPVNNQVDTFLNLTGDVEGIDFLACDFEKAFNNPSAQFANDAFLFCTAVKAQTGKRCLFYSNPSIVQEWMFQYGVYWVRDYADLWIAQWPYYGWNNKLYEVPDETKGWFPRLPAGCTQWRFWQYSADNNGKGMENGVTSPDVDLDVFNGTVEDLLEWAGVEDVEEPEPYPWEYTVSQDEENFHLHVWSNRA
jgi:GH25 family lysozyme M1 (1,4-beta-N-acetylmuramidase)